jgi:hypothetical protein
MQITNSALAKHQRGGHIFAAIVALVAFVLIAASLMPRVDGTSAQATVTVKDSSSTESTPTPSPTDECTPEFIQKSVSHEGNKVDADFAQAYAKATANAGNLSEAQSDVLLAKAGQDAQVLAIWTSAFGLYEDPNDWKDLVDGNCLSKEGEKLHAQFEGVLTAKGTVITEANAPSNGVNSGVHGDTYGVSSSAGIHGDLRSVKVTLHDGTSVYILIRCGNVVHPSNPGLPEVPTDNPPPPKKVCPPDMPLGTWPVCKDVPTRDPAPRGNAPIGGGPNENPGPGTYIPPTQMEQPPTTPRVNPASPAPEPPAPQPPTSNNPKPKPVPTKDPAPPPPPQPEAPTPTAPETGCDASVPGVVC